MERKQIRDNLVRLLKAQIEDISVNETIEDEEPLLLLPTTTKSLKRQSVLSVCVTARLLRIILIPALKKNTAENTKRIIKIRLMKADAKIKFNK